MCSKLVNYVIDESICVRCGLCVKQCPVQAIVRGEDGAYRMDPSICVRCGQCMLVCPRGAIVKG